MATDRRHTTVMLGDQYNKEAQALAQALAQEAQGAWVDPGGPAR